MSGLLNTMMRVNMRLVGYVISGGICGLLSLSLPAWAGPPFLTDDPEPVEYQHHELYISTQLSKSADGWNTTLPHLDYNYGVSDNAHVHALLQMQYVQPIQGAHHYGYGDTELGMKYRLLRETDRLPMLSIYPAIEIPTGDVHQGLGNGKPQYFLPVWLQKNFVSWQVNGGGGYWVNTAALQRDHWFWGVQLQKDLSTKLTLGGELTYNTASLSGQGTSMGYNMGGVYNVDAINHILFSAGRGLKNISTNRGTAYLGYQITW